MVVGIPMYYNPYVDDENRLNISCICDSTLTFALQLKNILESLGCTDIKLDGKMADESEIPKGKPWCNYKFFASGLMPEGVHTEYGTREADYTFD